VAGFENSVSRAGAAARGRTERDLIAGEPGILHTVIDTLEHAEKAILEERRRL
jgi:hypothetical protein